jgi:hypothetical protein
MISATVPHNFPQRFRWNGVRLSTGRECVEGVKE